MCSWLSLLDVGRDVRNIDPHYIWGLNFCIRKSVLFSCGGFHPDLVPKRYQRWQGDGESGLAGKLRCAGFRADYLKDARVVHHCGPERLSSAYFERRAYYQGVCDSFAEIRSRHGLPSPECLRSQRGRYWRLRARLAEITRGFRVENSRWKGEARLIKHATDDAEKRGWLFHQTEVAADAALLEWVLRSNFLGTDIRKLAHDRR